MNRYSVVAALLLTSRFTQAQDQASTRLSPEAHAQAVAAFQQELNTEYRDPSRSPLPPHARKKFTGLPFFPANYAAYVEARFVRDSSQAPFRMPTSTSRRPLYQKYGELHFTINGQPLRLTVYQDLDLRKDAKHADYLFVPFTDRTNGRTSYGGERYLDMRMEQVKSGQVLLDFNRAYNPYCAYSSLYSCPVPPAENRLPVEVRAGVQSDH